MSEGKIIIKSGLWYTVSNFFLRGIVFLTTPIFTRLLSQEEFGYFSNYSSWMSILIIVVTLSLEATLISARFEFEERLDSYMKSILILGTVSTLVWFAIVNVFMNPISGFVELSPVHINSMFAYLLFLPAVNLFQSREQFFYRYKTSVLLSFLLSVGASVLSIVFVISFSNRLDGRILGYILPTILVGMVLYVLIWGKGIKIAFSDWSYALKICIPYIPHLLSLTVLGSTDRIMITKICGEGDTALYSVAYNVAMIITMLLSALNGAFSPWLGEKLVKKEYKDIRKVSKIYICIFAYLVIGVMLLAPEVLMIMGGKAYMSAQPVMIPVILGCMCQFLYTLFVNVEQFSKKTVGMAFASMSAAVLNYGLNMWLIPKFGYVAAAYTTLIGYMWLLAIHMILVRFLKLNQVYSYKFVLTTVAGMSILSLGMQYLYNHALMRYVIICMYALILIYVGWKNRKEILKILKK